LLEVERRLRDLAFFVDFFALFFKPFFVADAFFATLALLAGFFFTRFFDAEALASPAGRDLRPFLAVRFLAILFLGAANTVSF
jgi:hypothetical protein